MEDTTIPLPSLTTDALLSTLEVQEEEKKLAEIAERVSMIGSAVCTPIPSGRVAHKKGVNELLTIVVTELGDGTVPRVACYIPHSLAGCVSAANERLRVHGWELVPATPSPQQAHTLPLLPLSTISTQLWWIDARSG